MTWFFLNTPTKIMSMSLVLNMPESCICKGSEYVKVIQGSEYAWIWMIMPEYAGVYVNMRKAARMAFALHFVFVIPCLLWTGNYLFQQFHETRSYSLKEHEAIFLKKQDLIFTIIARSIWFKVSEYPFKQNKNMLKNLTVLWYTYFYISLNALRPTFFNIYNLQFFTLSKYR